MEKYQVVDKIYEIAKKLKRDGSSWTRADLSYELKGLGVTQDSFSVDELVWDAYQVYNDEAIRDSFVNNSMTNTIVDEYRVCHLSANGEFEDAIFAVNFNMVSSSDALDAIGEFISDVLNADTNKVSTQIRDAVVGTSGVVRIQNAASDTIDRYGKMVEMYGTAKATVKTSISDFTFIREEINKIYSEYLYQLIDVFGDKIRSVSPELFDFDSIGWLDVDSMFQNISLEYDNLSNTCSALLSQITDQFADALKNSVSSYKGANGGKAGLALAGLNMLSHYLGAAERTAALEKDLNILQGKVRKDAVTIGADIKRLYVIYRTLNEVFIPKADTFFKNSTGILSSSYNDLVNSLYDSPKTRELRDERKALVGKYKMLSNSLNDIKINLNYYNSHIVKCRQELIDNEANYKLALKCRPSKPFFLANILTLGYLQRNYNRDMYDWHSEYAPFINSFESLRVDLQLDKEEVNKLERLSVKYESEKSDVVASLQRNADKMHSALKLSDELREKVAGHLEPILKLLSLGKEILSSSLDGHLVDVAEVDDIEIEEISDTTKQRIAMFTESLKNDCINSEYGQLPVQYGAQIDQAAGLINQLAELQVQKLKTTMTVAEYKRRYSKILERLDGDLASIDKKADIIKTAIKKVNESTDNTELQEALMSMSEQVGQFSNEDIHEFLKGNRIIVL